MSSARRPRRLGASILALALMAGVLFVTPAGAAVSESTPESATPAPSLALGARTQAWVDTAANPAAVTAAMSSNSSKLSSELDDRMRYVRHGLLRVMVSVSDRDASVESFVGRSTTWARWYFDNPRFYAAVTPDQLASLLHMRAVMFVEPDVKLTYFTSASTVDVHARSLAGDGTGVWSFDKTAGAHGALRSDIPGLSVDQATGAGVTVAITDSGVDRTHKDFGGWDCEPSPYAPCESRIVRAVTTEHLIGGEDLGDSLPTTEAASGHGTHVAGIVAGNGYYARDGADDAATYGGDGVPFGVAPQAKLIMTKNGDTLWAGLSSFGLEWQLENATEYGIRVSSNSWGCLGGCAFNGNSATGQLFKDMYNAGIVTVFAAGNDGGNISGATFSGNAQSPYVLGVASYQNEDHRLASSSSRGSDNTLPDPATWTPESEPVNGERRPDVGAPGVGIWSARTLTGGAASGAPRVTTSDVIGGGTNGIREYATMGGTSMATPHVAGAAALAFSACPNTTPLDVMRAVMATAGMDVLKTTGPGLAEPFEVGYGGLEVRATVDWLLSRNCDSGGGSDPTPTPTALPAPDPTPPSPSEANIADPFDDANYINDQGSSLATGANQQTPSDASSVGDFGRIWFTNTSETISLHIETQAKGPASGALVYRVQVDPGTGTRCLWFEATLSGAGNSATANQATLRDTCPTPQPNTTGKVILTQRPDLSGITTLTFPVSAHPALALGRTLGTPSANSRHYVSGLTAPAIDDTRLGSSYRIVASSTDPTPAPTESPSQSPSPSPSATPGQRAAATSFYFHSNATNQNQADSFFGANVFDTTTPNSLEAASLDLPLVGGAEGNSTFTGAIGGTIDLLKVQFWAEATDETTTGSRYNVSLEVGTGTTLKRYELPQFESSGDMFEAPGRVSHVFTTMLVPDGPDEGTDKDEVPLSVDPTGQPVRIVIATGWFHGASVMLYDSAEFPSGFSVNTETPLPTESPSSTPTPTADPSASPEPPSTGPRYTNFAAPSPLGQDAAEPSIGVNPQTGNVFFQSYLQTLRVSDFNDADGTATWEDVAQGITTITNLDPILFTDRATGRTYVSQLAAGCSLMAYTDDDGESWTENPIGCGLAAGADHQTVGGGSFAPGVVQPVGDYPNSVYYCAHAAVSAQCAFSLDGGDTFGPSIPMYTIDQCRGLHGHLKVAPDGTVYVPHGGCGVAEGLVDLDKFGQQAVVVSEDNGLTWDVRVVPGGARSALESDPSVAIGDGGTVYLGWQEGNFLDATTSKPFVGVSHDKGQTWENIQNVGADLGIENIQFPTMIAGDDDRAAFAFLGTTTVGDDQAADFGVNGRGESIAEWHLYISTTYDGGATWSTVNATPGDPVQRGCIWLGGGSNRCRNLLDFNDLTIDETGRVLAAYADGCVAGCVLGTQNSYTAVGTIARQSGGLGLLAAFDPVVDPTPTEEPTENPTPDPTPAGTKVALTSAATGTYSDGALFEALLTDDAGTPLSNEELSFSLVGASWSDTWTATTGNDGVARDTRVLDGEPGGDYQLTVRYAGRGTDYAGSADPRFFVITKEATGTVLRVTGKGSKRSLEAVLTDDDGVAIEGRVIQFFAGSNGIGSATTDPAGYAVIPIPSKYQAGHRTYSATFEGDRFYLGSSGSKAV